MKLIFSGELKTLKGDMERSFHNVIVVAAVGSSFTASLAVGCDDWVK